MDWNAVLTDPRFLALDNDKKMSIAQKYYTDFVESDKRVAGLEQRKKDDIKKKLYESVTATFPPSEAETKSSRQLGLERIAEVGAKAMRGESVTEPFRAMGKLTGEIVGLDIEERATREEAETALKTKEYGKYGRMAVGNVTKGMASVPSILLSAPVQIVESISRGVAEATAPKVSGEERAELVGEASKTVGNELFGWIGEILDDPIRVAFERPEDVAFAVEMAKGGIKGAERVVDYRGDIKVRNAAIRSLRGDVEAVEPPSLEVKIVPKEKPTPIKADVFPDKVTEGGFVKVPRIEDIAKMGVWAKENASNAYRSIKEFFMPMSTVKNSEMLLGLRYEHLGTLNRLEAVVLREHKKLAELGPEENAKAFRVLDGQVPIDSAGLSAKGRQATRNIRRLSDKAWDGYLERGIIDLNTYKKHKGNYVKYMYLKYLVGDKGATPGAPSGKLDLTQLKARADLTPEQRRAIGWVEDASIAGPIGVAQAWGDLLKYDYLKKISENPDWVWPSSVADVNTGMLNKRGQKITKRMSVHELAEEAAIAQRISDKVPNNLEARRYAKRLNRTLEKLKAETSRVPKDYVQIPNNPNYGALRGAFVRKPIAQDIMPVFNIANTGLSSRIVSGAIEANQKLMAAFKVGKVALNPPTIIRNVGSNIVQANLSGVPIWEIPTYLMRGFSHTLKKDVIWGQARRHGIFKTNWGQTEIGEIKKALINLEKKPYPDLLAGIRKIAEQYGKIDDFFKMAKFAERIREGDTYTKAAIEAHKWHMDYSLATPAVKVARGTVAPFVTYQYKVLPLLIEAAMKRPWVYLKYIAIPSLAKHALLQNEGITEDEFEKLRKDLPIYIKNSGTAMPLPWKSKEGVIQWINYEYFMPFGNAWTLSEDIQNFMAVSPEGAGIGDLLRGIGIGNPIADTVYGSLMLAKGTDPPIDTFTKRPIYNRLDSPDTKMKKLMYWLYSKWAPGVFTKEGALGYTMRVGEEDRYGREVTPGQAAGRWVGLNITAPTPEQEANYRIYFIGELRREMRRVMKSPDISDEEKAEVQENFQKMIDQLNK